MGRLNVTAYETLYGPGNGARITVWYDFGSGGSASIRSTNILEVEYILEVLRFEKPVFYDDVEEVIFTGQEPVGEAKAHAAFNNWLASKWKEPPDLERWLESHPEIARAIIWEDFKGPVAYPDWSSDQKLVLHAMFQRTWNGERLLELPNIPDNAIELQDDDSPKTALNYGDAWSLYAAFIAQSLVAEIQGWVSWSLTQYAPDDLAVLLDSRQMFKWNDTATRFEIEWSKGTVVPTPPYDIFRFVGTLCSIGSNQLKTIVNVLHWCRWNLCHYLSPNGPTQNMWEQWQYRGYPPVKRIIEGTPYIGHPEDGIWHRTAGCHGTAGFLRVVLRTVNIPVKAVHEGGGHSLPYFPREGKYLSHGDDPYVYTFRWTSIPTTKLLIDQQTFDEWFGPGVPDEVKKENVGRRPRDLVQSL